VNEAGHLMASIRYQKNIFLHDEARRKELPKRQHCAH